jgi:hypothetical protein
VRRTSAGRSSNIHKTPREPRHLKSCEKEECDAKADCRGVANSKSEVRQAQQNGRIIKQAVHYPWSHRQPSQSGLGVHRDTGSILNRASFGFLKGIDPCEFHEFDQLGGSRLVRGRGRYTAT